MATANNLLSVGVKHLFRNMMPVKVSLKKYYSAMEKFFSSLRGASLLAAGRLPVILALMLGSAARLSADPFVTERTIIQLAESWHEQVQIVSDRKDLISFCRDGDQRVNLFELLDEIYYHHALLEKELQAGSYHHSERTVRRILKEIDRLKAKHHPDDLAEFMREQCSMRSKIERKAKVYNTAFGPHSYGGKIYAQEAITDWYFRRLSKRIGRIKRHVEQFYAQQLTMEWSDQEEDYGAEYPVAVD